MPSPKLPLTADLIIIHQGHSKVTEGWHKATIHDIQPYRDSWGDKMMVYFRLEGDTDLSNPLAWICPLLATPRNKTGKFLEALGRRVEDGHQTSARDLIGLTLWLKTTLVTHNEIPFYKVTQFNYEAKGGDLFDAKYNTFGPDSSTRIPAHLTTGRGADDRSNGVDKPTRSHKPGKPTS